jgi:hypothetical protein
MSFFALWFREDFGMPTPKRPPASLDAPTREQLDELDALMERMLALPVDQLVEARDPERTDSAPSVEREVAPAAASQSVLTSEALVARPVQTERAPPTPAPRQEVVRRPAAHRGPTGRINEPVISAAAGTGPPMPGWLRPLRPANQVFDAVTQWLGPLGRWLRGPRGRCLIGWTGVLFLVAAVGWALWDAVDWSW